MDETRMADETRNTAQQDVAGPPDPAASSGVTGAVWGEFANERKIGSGGMGSVYRARQAGLDRIVALKVLPVVLSQSADYRRRFAAEAKAAGRISSPHVVTVYTCGEHAGRLWYAMEFVDGQDLALRLRGGWHPDWRESLRIGAQAARGLAAAHRFSLVHRDIKPGNLMMTPDGTVKVADFGLVRNRQDEASSDGSLVVGTMAYIAPEQARGEACDHRADLYALGCVLYELLCRRPPFSGSTMAGLIAQHLQAPPTPLRRHAPWLPEAVEDVVLRLLAKDPAGRPADAASLANELERLGHAVPSMRRNRVPLLVGGAVAAGFLAIGLWWMRREPEPAPARASVAPVQAAVAPPPVVSRPLPPPAPVLIAAPEPSPKRASVPAKPDLSAINAAAAKLIASGEHLGPAEDLHTRLGQPTEVDRQGKAVLWIYGSYTFVIEDGLVLNARKR